MARGTCLTLCCCRGCYCCCCCCCPPRQTTGSATGTWTAMKEAHARAQWLAGQIASLAALGGKAARCGWRGGCAVQPLSAGGAPHAPTPAASGCHLHRAAGRQARRQATGRCTAITALYCSKGSAAAGPVTAAARGPESGKQQQGSRKMSMQCVLLLHADSPQLHSQPKKLLAIHD